MTLLTLDGQVRTRWTSPTTTGAGDGGHAVWVDAHGDIYLNQKPGGSATVEISALWRLGKASQCAWRVTSATATLQGSVG
jgi:hypothetical protein